MARACVNYLETSLTAKNGCLLLSQSRLFEESELTQRCWEVIDAQVGDNTLDRMHMITNGNGNDDNINSNSNSDEDNDDINHDDNVSATNEKYLSLRTSAEHNEATASTSMANLLIVNRT